MAKDSNFNNFVMPLPRRSLRPLGVVNSNSTYDRTAGYYGSHSCHDSRNKENEESVLCTDFPIREVGGKSPVVVHQWLRPKSDEMAGRKVKPRRSMLGLRSKMSYNAHSSDDSTYTLSKPLYSSSPVAPESLNIDWNGKSKQEPRIKKATSSPTLVHPFETSDADTSSFFTKDHSEGTWSVFKSNKSTAKFKLCSQETPLSRNSIADTVPQFHGSENNLVGNKRMDSKSANSRKSVTAQQKLNLEWLSLKFQNELLSVGGSDKKYTEKNDDSDSDSKQSYKSDKTTVLKDDSDHQQYTFGCITRAQAKKDRKKFCAPLMQQEDSSLGDGAQLNDNNDPIPSASSDDEAVTKNSLDSYVLNEAAVVNDCTKLEGIEEEGASNISSKCAESSDEIFCSDEYLSTNEVDDSYSQDLNTLCNLVSDFKKEKDVMDNAFSVLFKQKEVYDRKWNQLMSSLHKIKHDTKKGEKLNTEKSASKLTSNSKNFSGLKANFHCLKTPVRSNKKKNRSRKSTCYTPNSLSVLVGDQINDIFGEM